MILNNFWTKIFVSHDFWLTTINFLLLHSTFDIWEITPSSGRTSDSGKTHLIFGFDLSLGDITSTFDYYINLLLHYTFDIWEKMYKNYLGA